MLNKYYRDTLSDPGAASSDLAVDAKTLSVSGILCTASVDADGDSIEPAGIILDRHKLNPVVCLNHRSKDLPVGIAEDANGNYTVRIKDYKLVHTARFHDNALGVEVFKMYEARILRGWSIAFIPLQMGMMPPAAPGRKRGSRITAGELMEYSAVTIPNNPETLAAYLGKGFHPDADAILRPMFEPFAAKLKEWANGWTPPAAVAKEFDPDQPRADDGKWTDGGGSDAGKPKTHPKYDANDLHLPMQDTSPHTGTSASDIIANVKPGQTVKLNGGRTVIKVTKVSGSNRTTRMLDGDNVIPATQRTAIVKGEIVSSAFGTRKGQIVTFRFYDELIPKPGKKAFDADDWRELIAQDSEPPTAAVVAKSLYGPRLTARAVALKLAPGN